MAKITLFGATGNIGSRILAESLSRGHEVNAVVRAGSEESLHENAKRLEGDIFDAESVIKCFEGSDIVISAYGPGYVNVSPLTDATKNLLAAAEKTGARLIAVGGAGTLRTEGETILMNESYFPGDWKPIAQAHQDALGLYLGNENSDWTVISPSAMIEPGERTGKFKTGNRLIRDSEGNSKISMEDFAVAILNEVESPEYKGRQFTAGY